MVEPVRIAATALEPGLIVTDSPRSAKPHQNPAFPAAFVFQSNSASYLAVCTPASDQRKSPSGS